MPEQKRLAPHGKWLSDQTGLPKSAGIAPGINGFLLSAESGDGSIPFRPGAVYRLARAAKFKSLFGVSPEALLPSCYSGKQAKFEQWKAAYVPAPVLVEISPVCDVHQGKRLNAILLGGLVFPSGARDNLKRSDSIEVLPSFSLRWAGGGFASQPAFLVCFSRLKTTLPCSREPNWLLPWFRIRELPTASLRNWHSSHAARVGFVSL
jgi:hypothetical protein